jgi:nucleoid-associated protein YgaU
VAEAPPPGEPVIEPVVTVAAVEADTAGGLYVAGTAETSEPVRIYLDDEPIGEATPSPSGTWLVETRREVPPGTYRVRADQIDRTTGDVIARAEVPFEREIVVAALKPTATTGAADGAEVSGEAPQLETVIIKRGDNLWRIARRVYGRGIRYSTIYQANRDQIGNPRWIYPGQVFVLPAGDANWKN